jgi:hypothetical protein
MIDWKYICRNQLFIRINFCLSILKYVKHNFVESTHFLMNTMFEDGLLCLYIRTEGNNKERISSKENLHVNESRD